MIENKYLEKSDSITRYNFYTALDEIKKTRRKSKDKNNSYIVLNTDEPYIDEVVAVINKFKTK